MEAIKPKDSGVIAHVCAGVHFRCAIKKRWRLVGVYFLFVHTLAASESGNEALSLNFGTASIKCRAGETSRGGAQYKSPAWKLPLKYLFIASQACLCVFVDVVGGCRLLTGSGGLEQSLTRAHGDVC